MAEYSHNASVYVWQNTVIIPVCMYDRIQS